MNCPLTINNYFGREYRSDSIQLEPCIVMFKVISDLMAHWYDM